jgi:hypothetical protein
MLGLVLEPAHLNLLEPGSHPEGVRLDEQG